jgi:hypothetical protein
MKRNGKSSWASGARVAGVVVVAAATLGLAPGSASAAAPKAPAQSPAIVGPLLQVFGFGADVGIPTGCQLVSAGFGSGAAFFGYSQQLAPVVNAINSGCTAIQTQADAFIAMGNKSDGPLAAWNPLINPLLQSTADSVTQAGTTYGDALAPFGTTIAGLGGTINFFQGH